MMFMFMSLFCSFSGPLFHW